MSNITNPEPIPRASAMEDRFRSVFMMKALVYEAAREGDLRRLKNNSSRDEWLTQVTGRGDNILHIAAKYGQVSFVRELGETHLDESKLLICKINDNGQNPLHIATGSSKVLVANHMVRILNYEYSNEEDIVMFNPEVEGMSSRENHRQLLFQTLLQKDNKGNTPLHIALEKGHADLARLFLLTGPRSLLYVVNNKKESPLYLAVKSNCSEAIDHILGNWRSIYDESQRLLLLSGPHGQTPLHVASKLKEKAGLKKLILNLKELINKKDEDGRTTLHYAAMEGAVDLIKIVLEKDPALAYSIDKDKFNPLFLACSYGQLDAILAIIKHCPDCTVVQLEQFISTALHHAKFADTSSYRKLLELPEIEELKNETDNESRTPLHKAIQDGNFFLAEALLSTEHADPTIKDKQGKTTIDLATEVAKTSNTWADLFHRLGLLQRPTTFVPYNTDLKEVRNTLSVVAALLVTITFAAGFTIPGGFDNSNGNAILGKKAGFIVFMLSDAYAMSCSIVALFSFIMVWDTNQPLELTDTSIYVLYQSLYGTVVAFMSGVYVMVSPKSLWTAVVVCVICSFVPILASWRLISNFGSYIVSATTRKIGRSK